MSISSRVVVGWAFDEPKEAIFICGMEKQKRGKQFAAKMMVPSHV
jgi:hypothetical protein